MTTQHEQPEKIVSLVSIEIALRNEECPSENVQWAIEHLNRFQELWEKHDAHLVKAARVEELVKVLDISKGALNLPDLQDRIRVRIQSLRGLRDNNTLGGE